MYPLANPVKADARDSIFLIFPRKQLDCLQDRLRVGTGHAQTEKRGNPNACHHSGQPVGYRLVIVRGENQTGPLRAQHQEESDQIC